MAGKMFSLDSYKKKADKDYGDFQIRVAEDCVVTLRNPLRISEEKRERLFDLVKEFNPEKKESAQDELWQEVGADEPEVDPTQMTKLIMELFELVGDENVNLLVDQIRGDFPVIMAIFEDYFEAVGLGEASSSEG